MTEARRSVWLPRWLVLLLAGLVGLSLSLLPVSGIAVALPAHAYDSATSVYGVPVPVVAGTAVSSMQSEALTSP